MVIPSDSDMYAPYNRVKKSIDQFTKEHSISYLLEKYIEKNFWVNELCNWFCVENIDNLTDFNYSRCFNYAINEGGLELFVGKNGFTDYVMEKGALNRVHVMISALAPYVAYQMVRYERRGDSIVMESGEKNYEWRERVNSSVIGLCKSNNLLMIGDKDLQRIVEGVSLELHGPGPSVFNILFEDGASAYPF
ncbi:MAG: hypothetical protein R6W86_11980 [Marinobacter sp.]|uniref:hypothetical protein n=1 Tax=Marinobacter sp. TaxID=50741 RepID=UPI00396EC7E4